MALEINEIEGVLTLTGTVSNTHVQELLNFISIVVETENKVILNLCGLKEGKELLMGRLNEMKRTIADDKMLLFYGAKTENVSLLFQQINNPIYPNRLAA
ncbi:hypothetical protein [Nonlabens sp. Asnod2-A12]|uniref:hypothetical protein n=1 Tax=Nonlabens sp. Asnod2-A12 TaxID=3160578 RepID=UPI00386FC6B3